MGRSRIKNYESRITYYGLRKKIGIIGCGNMGEALLRALVGSRWRRSSILVSEVDSRKTRYIRSKYNVLSSDGNTKLAARSDVIILAVKPFDVAGALGEIQKVPLKSKLIISIAAGVTTGRIEKILRQGAPVIRVMPNMPALVGSGISAICPGRHAKNSHIRLAEKIFSCLGDVIECEEGLMDAVTAISGSGPAYFFYLVECLIEAAKEFGISGGDAMRLAVKTASGSAMVLQAMKESPQALRSRVTSKGGTTEAAFRVFESKGLKGIIKEAVRAAAARAKELNRG